MTQYTFKFPAKILMGETSRKPRVLEYEGFALHAFDNGRIWYDTKTSKIRYENTESSADYWIVYQGYGIKLAHTYDDESIFSILDSHTAKGIQESLDEAMIDILNPSEYEAKQAAKRAEYQAEQEKKKRDQIKREEAERAAYEGELKEAAEKFKRGEAIEATMFEELCKRNGVKLHLRTIGMLRKRVSTIGTNGGTCYGGHIGQGAWDAVRDLKETLAA